MLKIDTKNIGTVNVGIAKTFTQTMFNEGDQEIHISNVSPRCGSCTVAHVEKVIIPPKGHGSLIFTFTPASTGIQIKEIRIFYTEGDTHKELIFTFSGNAI